MPAISSVIPRIRRWISVRVLPHRGVSAQCEAGEAAAKVGELTTAELKAGRQTVAGARDAAGGRAELTPLASGACRDPGAAAFFDVDNTLIKGASLLLFARGLARHRFFTAGQIASFAWKQVKFNLSGRENLKDMTQGREQGLDLVRGHRESELTELSRKIWRNSLRNHIFPGVIELARQHLAAGQEVWLVSATPVHAAQIIAEDLGFTGALGTVIEVEDDVFTGRMIGDILHGPGKRFAVAALARERGLDLARCTAYSDSFNDLPMLSVVGTAVAVNPDFPLRRQALSQGWQIHDFRRRGAKWFWAGAFVAVAIIAIVAAVKAEK